MPLTDVACRKAVPGEAQYKLADAEGMYLLVLPTGARYWRLDYRFRKKRKTLALGVYPDVSLLQAREKRADARKALAAGLDPSDERRAARQKRLDDFESVARAWFENVKAGWDEGHAGRVMSKLERDIFPEFGSKSISEVTASDVLAALRKIEARGAIDVTKRTRQYIGAIFRFAIAEGFPTQGDPASIVRDALKTVPRVRHRPML